MSSFDPNRTIVTEAMTGANVTQMMSAMPSIQTPLDLNRTSAMTAIPIPPGVQCRVIPGREVTMANGPATEAFMLEISGHSDPGLPGMAGPTVRTPLNLCLVLDRSGSMEGAPLEYAKAACNHVVDLMGPNDILSIVVFAETVDVLMPPQRLTNKEPVKQGIRNLQVGNTTDLYSAIQTGLNQVQSTEQSGRATRIVVLSDGDPTTGIKDYPSLVNLAGTVKDHGVTVTFLGFGPDYNEELLAGMAKKCGGNYSFIARPELIPEVFRLEVDKLLSVQATNLRFEGKLARWCQLRSATGLSPVPTGDTFVMPLSDLERGEVMQLVFAVDFPNHPLGHYRVMSGRLFYDDALTGKSVATEIDFCIEFSSDAAQYGKPVNPAVAQATQLVAASRAVEKTMMGLRTGQLTAMGAVSELQKTQALLLHEGKIQEAQEVTMALNALQSGDASSAQKTLMGTMINLDQGKSK